MLLGSIELCVRWYVTYRLSYRDLVAMMAERGIAIAHTTILRWVLHYVPEYERRWARFARPVDPSWRMDGTAVPVRGGRHYLYRAVDRNGKSVHSLLCRDRSVESAQAFFRGTIESETMPWPSKVNLDDNAATHLGLRLLGEEDRRWRSVEVRVRRYLSNVVEQDYRAIKQRCAPMLGLKSYRSAVITFAGVELAHRIRKQQFSLPTEPRGGVRSLKDQWECALTWSGAAAEQTGRGFPSTHQISTSKRLELSKQFLRPGGWRAPRKMFLGQNLCLLFMPQGARYWRYRYRYGGKEKTLALGTFPEVPPETARARHRAARQLLATGVDPSTRRHELRRISDRRELAA